jgi:predicted permease
MGAPDPACGLLGPDERARPSPFRGGSTGASRKEGRGAPPTGLGKSANAGLGAWTGLRYLGPVTSGGVDESAYRMQTIVQDLRYGLRMMRKAPTFSAAVIGTITLAIGANAAIFSVAHAVLLRQLPFRSPDELVFMWSRQTVREKAPFTLPDFIDYRDGNDVFERLSALAPWTATLEGGGEPERVQGLRVSADLFETLGADAAIGRTLKPEDDRPSAARVAVLTHGLWVRRFGADPGVIGTRLVLDGEAFTIVGVLRPGFFFPAREAELAAPLVPDADPRRGIRASVAFLRMVGRLRPRVPRDQAREAITAIAARLQRDFPETNARKVGVSLVPIADEILGGYRATLTALAAAVAGVLLIACANLANLTLARASTRGVELATRLALGATRARLVRQLLTESMVLAAIGGGGGAAAATVGVRLLLAFAPADLPRMQEITVDRTVLLFTLATTIIAGLAFGLIPALVASRSDLNGTLKDAARGASDGRERRRARHGLVAAGWRWRSCSRSSSGCSRGASRTSRPSGRGSTPRVSSRRGYRSRRPGTAPRRASRRISGECSPAFSPSGRSSRRAPFRSCP